MLTKAVVKFPFLHSFLLELDIKDMVEEEKIAELKKMLPHRKELKKYDLVLLRGVHPVRKISIYKTDMQ